MPTLKVPRPVAPQEVWAVLWSMAPYGWQTTPTANGFLVKVDQAEVRVRLKAKPSSTRIRLTLQYPWWTWLGLLAGVVGAVVTTAVYYGVASWLMRDVRGRLGMALGAPSSVAPAPAG